MSTPRASGRAALAPRGSAALRGRSRNRERERERERQREREREGERETERERERQRERERTRAREREERERQRQREREIETTVQQTADPAHRAVSRRAADDETAQGATDINRFRGSRCSFRCFSQTHTPISSRLLFILDIRPSTKKWPKAQPTCSLTGVESLVASFNLSPFDTHRFHPVRYSN